MIACEEIADEKRLDLHWRNDENTGNYKTALLNNHRNLDDQTLCYHCGAVPCPIDHTKEKEMRLIDLQHIKDIMLEKKELQDQLEKMKKEVKLIEYKNMKWKDERVMLKKALSDLQRESKNRSIKEKELSDHNRHLEKLNKGFDQIKKENASLSEENKNYKKIMISLSTQLKNSKDEYNALSIDAKESIQKEKILESESKKLKEENNNIKEELSKKCEEIQQMKDYVKCMTDRYNSQIEDNEMQEIAKYELIQSLRNKIEQLSSILQEEKDRSSLLEDHIIELTNEMDQLKVRLKSDTRFRSYVDVKRYANELQRKNETLVDQLKSVNKEIFVSDKTKKKRPKTASSFNYSKNYPNQ